MLELSQVTITRGGQTIVQDVRLQVAPGHVCALLGPNGAGKSTILQALAGELRPHRGQLRFDHQALAAYSRQALARRRGVLPQHSRLTFPFSAREVVQMGRSPHFGATTAAEDRQVVQAAMAQAGVAELADRSFTTLSGGEQQRVHFARVLAQLLTSAADPPQRPRLLLLDEPTASLDPAYQHKLLRATRQLAAQNVVVVVVLHDLNLAARFADRFMLLDQGRSVAQGAAAEVLTEQYLSQVYELPCRVVPHPQQQGWLVTFA